jgi:peptidoglycan/LPS O-acetylase OafA/YrhL
LESNTQGFNPRLHALRGIAAAAVMLFHWEQFFPAFGALVQGYVPADSLIDPTVYVGFGWMGVPLFFILSGWLLGGQVIRADINPGYLRQFWSRRFLRIYPAVWAELLILLLIAGSIPGLVNQASYDTLHLQFLLWLNLPPFMAAPLNGVWWTLPVELGFYLLLPLLGWCAGFINWRALLVGSLLITLGWRFWIFSSTEVENYVAILPVLDSLLGTLFTFMLGFSLNFLPDSVAFEQRRRGVIIGLLLLLALMQWQLWMDAVYWSGHWILVVWPPLVALSIAVLVYHLKEPLPGRSWLASPVLVWLGHVSFGIYLWHFQVMRAMVLLYPDAWSTPAQSGLALMIAVPVTLVLAALSFYLIERPLMGWGKRKLSHN